MTLSDLADKRIALWGFGREGKATLDFLNIEFSNKKIFLINQEQVTDFNQAYFIFEDDFVKNLDKFDVVIKSPGISFYHPAVETMQKNDIEITSATNIWFSIPKKGKVIAITGSNGKSTTSALLHHILAKLGHNALLGGNIGTPLLSLKNDAQFYVVELSSYQTCDLKFAPDIAVLLNLFPEHIQWHKSHEAYYKDKCNLLRQNSPINIVNYHEPRTHNIAKNTIFFNDEKEIHHIERDIYDGKILIGSTDIFPLLGNHNLENLCAALAVCKQLNLDLKKCLEASYSYVGLKHRLQNVGTIGKYTYINDSISTDPEATMAALEALKDQKITLLCGGQNRQQDYKKLCELIDQQKINAVVTMYETGPLINEMIKIVPKRHAKNLDEAMTFAKEMTSKDGYIVLSPAAPSYDGFKNFEERGDLFIKLANENQS